jgi:hypothetical protein
MKEQITVEQFHERLKAQGVSSREHTALVCPICGTVQSLASLIAAGVPEDKAENYVGFSCEGRFTNAGPWPSSKDKTAKAKARRKVRGCNWTLGGLFKVHELEIMQDGVAHPMFEIASAEDARALEVQLSAQGVLP